MKSHKAKSSEGGYYGDMGDRESATDAGQERQEDERDVLQYFNLDYPASLLTRLFCQGRQDLVQQGWRKGGKFRIEDLGFGGDDGKSKGRKRCVMYRI